MSESLVIEERDGVAWVTLNRPERLNALSRELIRSLNHYFIELYQRDEDACFAPVLDWEEAPQHPHNRARHTFITVDGVVQPAPAPRFSRTPPPAPRAPSARGQDSEAVLLDWGIDETRQAGLRESGIL